MKEWIIKEKFVIVIFFLAILSGYFWNHEFFGTQLPEKGDEGQYSCIAKTLLETGVYSDCGGSVYREPVYPMFIAGIYAIFGGNHDGVRYAQLVLFGLICVMVYNLGVNLFNKNVGILASLFLASWWALANYTGRYTRELLMAFLILLLVNSLHYFFKNYKTIYLVAVGFLLGALVLLNSITQFLIVLVLANFIYISRLKMSYRNIALSVFTIFIVFSLTISPWIIRNKKEFGVLGVSAVPSTGLILSYRASVMEKVYPEIHKYFFGHLFGYYFAEKIWPEMNILLFRQGGILTERKEMLFGGMNIFEVDNKMAEAAKKKIISQPHKYILMSALDFINLNSPLIPQRIFGGNTFVHFTFAEGRKDSVPGFVKGGLLLVFRMWWYVVLTLVIWGVIASIRKWDKYGWLILLILYFNIIYSAIHAIPRYISPVYSIYILFAAVGFFQLNNLIKKKLIKQ